MKAHWFVEEKNLGDRLSPIIIEYVTGIKPKWVPGDEPCRKLLALGSILEHAKENDILWGTGTKFRITIPELRTPPLAVRGPRTAECIGPHSTNVFGDPGILLPEIFTPVTQAEDKIVFIPHYVDFSIVKNALQKHHHIFKDSLLVDVVNESFQSVVDKIGRAKLVVSSSLHGLIFAEAYQKPAAWLKVTDRIIGGNFKFNDYYEGTSRQNKPICFDEKFAFLKIVKPPELPKSNKKQLITKLRDFYSGQQES